MWTSADFLALDAHGQLCFIWLISNADDEGRLKTDAAHIERVLHVQVEEQMTLMEARGMLRAYVIDGQAYVELSSFKTHQRIDRPSKSKYPPFPNTKRSRINRRTLVEHSASDPRALDANPAPRARPRIGSDPSSSVETPERPDVESLCSLLVELLASNGMRKLPTIGEGWRKAARLLLDADGAPLDEAQRVMRWALQDSFWRTNIQSLPKFREKYEQLRLKANLVAAPKGHQNSRDEWDAVLAGQEETDRFLDEVYGITPVTT